MKTTDFCVIGGGIAGLSVAAELSAHAKVILLEREADLAYHTSGRSAALYSELTAESTALSLSKLTRPFLVEPPDGFSRYPLHSEVPSIFTATADQADLLQREAAKLDQPQFLDTDEMLERVPVLRTGEDGITAGLMETCSFRIDVGALVQGFRNQLTRQQGEILSRAEVGALAQDGPGWRVETVQGELIAAGRVVNAAGAWGDVIAEHAGVKPLGLKPMRRNIIVFDGPAGIEVSHWPAVASISGDYYFLPEAGKLMGSAADEVPSAPCDAQPEEYDIALAADRIESATMLEIRRIEHRWAGLRTFAPDRQLVAGYDADATGFFWLVGQGGFGMQTSKAAAVAAARLALEEALPPSYEAAGITADDLSPQRFD